MKIEQAVEKMQVMFPKKYWVLEATAFQHSDQTVVFLLKGYTEDLQHTQPHRSWETVILELELMAKDHASKPPTEVLNEVQSVAIAQSEASA